ncbi:hypothetical protein FHI69_02810 [Janthinobacterium lividum]|uniref:Tyr recombinase domain-containing protein n=1 Tax=Janthinobacterium lividum TaxID=29581 RepID=A0A5C4NW09_9BURK|nr:hypothetical protein [Janthinobacterium lividum]TNC78242.1 hypothetical protein FHI69_02810 [Janthinobacterium lividum]
MRGSLRWRRDSGGACSGAVRRAVAGDHLEAALWTIPAQSMKAGREHHVPLSGEVPALLRALPRQGNVIFSGRKRGAQLSGISLTVVLRCMQFDDITVHGSRSSFRDWRAEAAANTFSREVCEHALAHRLPDRKTLRWRDDLFD